MSKHNRERREARKQENEAKWTPFVHGKINPESRARVRAASISKLTEEGMTPEQATATTDRILADECTGQMAINNRYQVLIRELPAKDGWPAMFHLSIRRLDREVIHDWRDLQRIKNELIGPENEAVELYPAESRVLDTANQFHIYCLKQPGVRFPFGYLQDASEGIRCADNLGNSKQRPF